MGGALGLAVLSTIASSQTRAAGGTSAIRALTNGFDLAFTVAVGFALIGALVAAIALRPAAERAAVVELPEPIEAGERRAVAA
jgi:hypothetical protein